MTNVDALINDTIAHTRNQIMWYLRQRHLGAHRQALMQALAIVNEVDAARARGEVIDWPRCLLMVANVDAYLNPAVLDDYDWIDGVRKSA